MRKRKSLCVGWPGDREHPASCLSLSELCVCCECWCEYTSAPSLGRHYVTPVIVSDTSVRVQRNTSKQALPSPPPHLRPSTRTSRSKKHHNATDVQPCAECKAGTAEVRTLYGANCLGVSVATRESFND